MVDDATDSHIPAALILKLEFLMMDVVLIQEKILYSLNNCLIHLIDGDPNAVCQRYRVYIDNHVHLVYMVFRIRRNY